MSAKNETIITKDQGKKQLTVVRQFDAPLDIVWKAWTDSTYLDKWWAPKPWKARTKSMDFKPGGRWLYSMNGPQGEQHFAYMDFEKIDRQKNYVSAAGFCDESGVANQDMTTMRWNTQFEPAGNATKVTVLIGFNNEAQLEQLVEMGFKEGFTMAHANLDELLEKETVHK